MLKDAGPIKAAAQHTNVHIHVEAHTMHITYMCKCFHLYLCSKSLQWRCMSLTLYVCVY